MKEELVNPFAEKDPECGNCAEEDCGDEEVCEKETLSPTNRNVFIECRMCCDDENCGANGEVIGVLISAMGVETITDINPMLINVGSYEFDPDTDADIDMLALDRYYTPEEIEDMGLDFGAIAEFWSEW